MEVILCYLEPLPIKNKICKPVKIYYFYNITKQKNMDCKKKLENDGYTVTFGYADGKQIARAEKDGLRFTRTGKEIHECLKQLVFDVYGKLK